MLRAVLDANVYVSAVVHPAGVPGQLIESFLHDAAFEIILSPAIAAEVLRALEYPKVRKAIRSAIQPGIWFHDVFVLADVVPGENQVFAVSDDPDDNKYLAAAIEGRATFVVSGDQHLLALAEYEGVRMVTPRAFLRLVGR